MKKQDKPEGQRAWGGKVAAYLFLAGGGAGAYLAAFLTALIKPEFREIVTGGLVLSVVMLAGGILFLIFDLGRKQKAFWAFAQPGNSWIARGAMIISIFAVLDFILIMAVLTSGSPELRSGIRIVIGSLAALGAILTLTYTGMVLGAARPVAFWNPAFLTGLFFISGISAGIALVVFYLSAMSILPGQTLDNSIHALARSNAIVLSLEVLVIILFMLRMSSRACASVEMIIKGQLAAVSWVFIGAGTLICLIFDYYTGFFAVSLPPGLRAAAIPVNLLGLCGGFVLRYVTVKAGIASPLKTGRATISVPRISEKVYANE